MNRKKWILPMALLVTVFLVGTYVSAWLLMPIRSDYGATWETYLQEPKNSIDVLCFGSSLAYCNISPSVIWDESGITSYVMAGPEQTLPISYYYIREACKTQQPKALVLEVTGMFFPKYCNYTKANISYMPWSANRIAATIEAAEKELLPSLLFPILDYHSLWTTAHLQTQLKQHLNPGTDIFAGYTYLEEIRPQDETVVREFSAQTEDYARNLEYLQKIYRYCEEQSIQLVLIVTPTKGIIPEEACAQLKEDIAQLEQAVLVDFNEAIDELNIDDKTDWYDFLHLNCRGAQKFSRYFAEFLSSQLGLTPTEIENTDLWQARADHFTTQIEKLS